MTRIFTDGAEMGDVLFWDSPGALYVTGTCRSGVYAYNYGYGIKYFTPISEFYFRMAMRDDSFGECGVGSSFIPRVRNDTTIHAQLYFANDNKIHLDAGGSSNVATSTITFLTNTWYLMEMYLKIDDSPNGRCIVKINGITQIDFTGDTRNGATTTADNLLIGALGYHVTIFDDLALNDTNGSVDNSWCGNGFIEKLTPNANGDVNQFTGNDGNQTDNYLLVDEAVPDGDTTYTSGSEVGQQDMYHVSDYSGAGKSIRRIWAEARVKDFSYTTKEVIIGYKTSGSVVLSGSAALSGVWGLLKGEEALTNVSASAAWTESDLDDIQFVIESQA